MSPFIDYHVHTEHSYDCKIPMAEMCRQAIARGISEIAFTDHFNNHLLDIDLGYYQADAYFADLEKCRKQFPELTIRAGIEVGEPHRWESKVRPILDSYPYDVVLGSLHWVGRDSMFDPNYFRARSPEQAYGHYYSELLSMVKHGGFDILAHTDLPKRIGYTVYGEISNDSFEKDIRLIWEACVQNHIIPEINTKGMRYAVSEFHPTNEMLGWYHEAGGQGVTLGSDAHHADHLADQFELASETVNKVGLTQYYQFEGRRLIVSPADSQPNFVQEGDSTT